MHIKDSISNLSYLKPSWLSVWGGLHAAVSLWPSASRPAFFGGSPVDNFPSRRLSYVWLREIPHWFLEWELGGCREAIISPRGEGGGKGRRRGLAAVASGFGERGGGGGRRERGAVGEKEKEKGRKERVKGIYV